jgi:hypothetical protein
MSETKRCPTTRGPRWRCDYAVGHAGPCETREEARAWVGPALAPRPRVSRLQCVGTSDNSPDTAASVLADGMRGEPPPEAA